VSAVSGGGPVVVRVYGCSDVGRTRDHNEDAFVVADLANAAPLPLQDESTETPGDHGAMFMVADGMGGAAAGEIASSMAVDVVLRELQLSWIGAAHPDADAFAQALLAATSTANERIHAFARDHPEYRGMGTTATIAGVLGDTLYIAQVGDSRAYLVRSGVARQITKDQSLMQRLIEAGEITAEEAEVSERRNIILQALGPEAVVKVDITHQQLRRGDTLVLCSDGLSGLVRDHEIAQAVMEDRDLRAVCLRLIAEANSRGGPDNITVVAAQFDGPGLSDAEESDQVGHQTFPVPGIEPPTDPTPPPPDVAPAAEAVASDTPPPTSTASPNPARRPARTNTLEIAPRRVPQAPTTIWIPRLLPLILAAAIVIIAIVYLIVKR
jgi:serine/threonine protein phosphatase PrpC